MRRTLRPLPILILACLALIPISCSSSKAVQPIALIEDCPKEAGFCADFPTYADEKQSTKVHHPAEDIFPASTDYVTEVYPGKETEQYMVHVYDDDPEGKTINALLANYNHPWWKCLQGTGDALWTCTWRFDDDPGPSVTTEMLVAGPNKLYVVEASTMSKNDPTYVDEFLSSFKVNT